MPFRRIRFHVGLIYQTTPEKILAIRKDIEEYIDWKPSEEEKVSALVIGRTILQKHADSIMNAIWSFESDGGRFDQETNPGLRKAMVKAIHDSVPQAHILRYLFLGISSSESNSILYSSLKCLSGVLNTSFGIS